MSASIASPGPERPGAGGRPSTQHDIGSLNTDSTFGGRTTRLLWLGAEIPIVEHLTGLDRLPARRFRFTAVPPKIQRAGSFTVRAFAPID
ncbi:MAG: hypothetical protein GY929_25635 [Actinomycetia bacterium]|nr:hypothetical protein [Actinomycetes bacterium]